MMKSRDSGDQWRAVCIQDGLLCIIRCFGGHVQSRKMLLKFRLNLLSPFSQSKIRINKKFDSNTVFRTASH
jgi:hypothetical protein